MDCYLCNQSGLIPVFSWVKHGDELVPSDSVYVCKCSFAKDLGGYRQKEITDGGKRKMVMVREIYSKRFFDVFKTLQFGWTPAICRSFNPDMDYIEFFSGCRLACIKHHRETGEAKIFTPKKLWRSNDKSVGSTGKINAPTIDLSMEKSIKKEYSPTGDK